MIYVRVAGVHKGAVAGLGVGRRPVGVHLGFKVINVLVHRLDLVLIAAFRVSRALCPAGSRTAHTVFCARLGDWATDGRNVSEHADTSPCGLHGAYCQRLDTTRSVQFSSAQLMFKVQFSSVRTLKVPCVYHATFSSAYYSQGRDAGSHVPGWGSWERAPRCRCRPFATSLGPS